MRQTMRELRLNGHEFRPVHWKRGSASPRCECGHDFGSLGGNAAEARAHHDNHLRKVQEQQTHETGEEAA